VRKWGTSVLVIDEAYYHFKYKQKVTPAIDEALHANRHAGLGLILSTQRMSMILRRYHISKPILS